MKDIFRLVVKLLKFGGSKTIQMFWIMVKLYLGRLLWKWGIRFGLVVLGGLLAVAGYYLFKI